MYYSRIINSGSFAKLPRPSTTEQFYNLYHTPIVDIMTLIYYSLDLYNLSINSSEVDSTTFSNNSKSYNFLDSLTDGTTSKVGDDFLPCPSENTPHLKNSSSITTSTYTTVTLPGNLDYQPKNGGSKKSKNSAKSDEYSTDANVRRWSILLRIYSTQMKMPGYVAMISKLSVSNVRKAVLCSRSVAKNISDRSLNSANVS